MSWANVEAVRHLYEAWAVGDFRAGVEDFDQHVVFVAHADFPEVGVYIGIEEIRDYMRRIFENRERVTLKANHLQAIGDTVIVHVLHHSEEPGSGIGVDDSHFQVFTFRGPKIVRLEAVQQEDDALETVGLGR